MIKNSDSIQLPLATASILGETPGLASNIPGLVMRSIFSFRLVCLLVFSPGLIAAVLAEERADMLYHRFDGGGVVIDGPSLLVRKNFSGKVSVAANYYVDHVSSASIDVLSSASPYTEERTEKSISVDYLHEKTIMSIGTTQSVESDFDATTTSFSISQDMFGDLTNVSLGFSLGTNTVGKNGDSNFREDVEVRNYRVSLTQVITKNMIAAASFESITDEGFLNNPYRSVRFIDPSDADNFLFQPEVYPGTRTSNAFAIRTKYYLPYRAAIEFDYRFFNDSWGISANTFELGYTHPWQQDWVFDVHTRFYDQSRADFYSDLFPFQDAQNFLARDKELSSFRSTTLGFGASYLFKPSDWESIDKGSVNLKFDYIQFDYDDFRDITKSGTAGNEPLYEFSANVIRLFVSLWF